MHIVVSGNIGAGASALCHSLARRYGWTAMGGGGGGNPFLPRFHADPRRWAFALEAHFLALRLEQARAIARLGGHAVQARSAWDGMGVFAENNARMGHLSFRARQTLDALMAQAGQGLRLPDLTIYVRADLDALAERIERRGREGERGISIDYLQGISDAYDRYLGRAYPGRVLTIEAGRDELRDPALLHARAQRLVDPLVGGLFPL